MRLIFRPLEFWPGELNPDWMRKTPPFSGGWNVTVNLLEREVSMLSPYRSDNAVILQVAADESAMRLDGGIRANARVGHPGVVVSFESRHGPLQYWTDHFRSSSKIAGWQANVRAIALGLEALRRVDRYGIAHGGQQYTGWKALTRPEEASTFKNASQAAKWLHAQLEEPQVGWLAILTDRSTLDQAYRSVAKGCHPDVGVRPPRRCVAVRRDGQPCRSHASPYLERAVCRSHASAEERQIFQTIDDRRQRRWDAYQEAKERQKAAEHAELIWLLSEWPQTTEQRK